MFVIHDIYHILNFLFKKIKYIYKHFYNFKMLNKIFDTLIFVVVCIELYAF